MAGDPTAFERAWSARVDDFDACIAAHYLARVQPDAHATFEWSARALEHARLVDPDRVRGVLPSLHQNLGRSYEDLGDPLRAAAEYRLAESCLDALPLPLRRLVEERRVPYLKIGRLVRCDPSDVESWSGAGRVAPQRGPLGGGPGRGH